MSTTYISVALRRQVYERAEGCCEYCRIPEAATFAVHEIDHIIAEKHGGSTTEDNLALACTICNKYKGSDLASLDPETGEIIGLYHPRQDKWAEHFQIQGAELIHVTVKGLVTIKLLQLNRREKVAERQVLIQAGIFPT